MQSKETTTTTRDKDVGLMTCQISILKRGRCFGTSTVQLCVYAIFAINGIQHASRCRQTSVPQYKR